MLKIFYCVSASAKFPGLIKPNSTGRKFLTQNTAYKFHCLITLLHKNINIKWHNYKLITSYCYIHKDITAFFEHGVYWFTSYIKPQKWVFLMFCNSLAIDLFLIIVDVSTFLVHVLKQFIVICRLICSEGSIAIGIFCFGV